MMSDNFPKPSQPAAIPAPATHKSPFWPALVAATLLGGLFHGGFHWAESASWPFSSEPQTTAQAPKTDAQKMAEVFDADFGKIAQQNYEKVLEEIETVVRQGYTNRWPARVDAGCGSDDRHVVALVERLRGQGFVVDWNPEMIPRCRVWVDLGALKK